MTYKYANNVVASLASPIGTTDTTITLSTGQGAQFPNLGVGDLSYATLFDSATRNVIEVVQVTAVTGDVLTVVRGQDGTVAHNYLTGDGISMRVVAGQFADFASKTYGGTFSSPIRVPTPASAENSTIVASTAWVKLQGYAALTTYVGTFNGRSGGVTLTPGDVSSALGYTPVNRAGDTMSGPLSITGNTTAVDSLITYASTAGYGMAVAGRGADNEGIIRFVTNDFTTQTAALIVANDSKPTVMSNSNFRVANGASTSYWGIVEHQTKDQTKSVVDRVNPSMGREWIDSTYQFANMTLDDIGNLGLRGQAFATQFNVSSSAVLKNIQGDLDGETAFQRVMQWLPKVYSLKQDPAKRLKAGLVVEEAPAEITDGKGHIDLYAALTELASAFQHYVKTHP